MPCLCLHPFDGSHCLQEPQEDFRGFVKLLSYIRTIVHSSGGEVRNLTAFPTEDCV